jgi:hypothetical protein
MVRNRSILISFEENEGKLEFYFSEEINAGLNLDELPQGFFCPVIKIIYTDYMEQYYVVDNGSEYPDLEYYTITRGGKNNRVYIDGTGTFVTFLIEEKELPMSYDNYAGSRTWRKESGAVIKKRQEAVLLLICFGIKK